MALSISAVVIRSIITGAGRRDVPELACAENVGLVAAKANRAKTTRTRLNFMAGLLRSAEQV
jgi:hypothetical protein